MTDAHKKVLVATSHAMAAWVSRIHTQFNNFRWLVKGLAVLGERMKASGKRDMFSHMQRWLRRVARKMPDFEDDPHELQQIFWDALEQHWSGANLDDKIMASHALRPLGKWPLRHGIATLRELNEGANRASKVSETFKFSRVLMSIFSVVEFDENAAIVMQCFFALLMQRRETEPLLADEADTERYVAYMELEAALKAGDVMSDDADDDAAVEVRKTDDASENDSKGAAAADISPVQLRMNEIDDALSEALERLFQILCIHQPFTLDMRDIVREDEANRKTASSNSAKNSPLKRKRDSSDEASQPAEEDAAPPPPPPPPPMTTEVPVAQSE